MITVLTFTFRKYLETPFEDFTSKLILAIGLIELIDDFDETDKEKLFTIEKFTHSNVRVSLYQLDRVVNPAKGEFSTIDPKFRFNTVLDNGDKKTIALTGNIIQKYLCIAIRQVHQIIIKNMKRYKIEHSSDGDGESSNVDWGKLL